MVLGPTKVSQFLLDAFLDYISSAERRVFQNALKFNDANRFPQDIRDLVMLPNVNSVSEERVSLTTMVNFDEL